MSFLGVWKKIPVLGLALGSMAIAGCAGITHSMDAEGEGHGGMDHGKMDHGSMNHESISEAMPGTDKSIMPGGESRHGVHGEGHSAERHSAERHSAEGHSAEGHDATGHDATGLTPAGHGHAGMHHGSFEVPAGQPVPQLDLTVEPDAMKGWNLQVETANFEFAPERVNQNSLVTDGHAHLYINGEKITRLYGPWYYLPALPEGEHEVRVELNANGHEVLTTEGKPIEATVNITVPAP